MRRIISAALLLCLGTAPVLLSTPAFADTTTGGTICGTTWQDLNGDGIRQANEPAMPNVGLSIGTGPFINTVSDTNGNYCFTNVAAGTYQVQSNDLAFLGGFGWTRPGPDSRFDWTTGLSRPITITARQDGSFTDVDHVDVGYLKAANDVHVVRITISKHGALHVGDTFEIRGYVGLKGTVPQQLGANLTVPAGLTILNTTGDMSTFVQGNTAGGIATTRNLPGAKDFVGVQVRVDQPLDNGAIQLQTAGGLYQDINPNDNTLTRYLSAGA